MIEVKEVSSAWELEQTHIIRKEVFVIEQNCPEDLEWEFEDESHHFIALINGIPAGTARWRETEYGIKLERFAVLKAYRNAGIGSAVLKNILEALPKDNRTVYLHAQLTAKNFYLKHGFVPKGSEFLEADIVHVKMILTK